MTFKEVPKIFQFPKTFLKLGPFSKSVQGSQASKPSSTVHA